MNKQDEQIYRPHNPVDKRSTIRASFARPFSRPALLPYTLGIVALLQGLFFLWLLPPWQHYDEPTHFEYAWLIANHGHLPRVGESDRTMQRSVLKSMLEHNFYWNIPKPDLLDETSKLSLGFSELDHGPAYYLLISLVLRLVRQLPITTQLYAARFVSLGLFVLTVVAAGGIASNLFKPRHPLRWALPLCIALLPSLADIMTAVNNDVGAICVFTCFLWAAVWTIRSGLTFKRIVVVSSLALLAPFVKNTAALAILLLPLVLLLALWVQQRWPWRYALVLGATAVIMLVMVFMGWGDAANWYRWPNSAFQSAPTRVNVGTGVHDYAVMVETRPNSPERYLLNPIIGTDLAAAVGQTVTIGGWVWSDQPVTATVPALLMSPRGSKELRTLTRPISITTTPTFRSWTLQVPPSTGTLYYAFIASTDETVNTRLYLRNPILVAGAFPTGTEPRVSGETAQLLTWDGRTVSNLVRNADATAVWPRLRPWIDRMSARSLRRSPAEILDALLDVKLSAPLMFKTVAPTVLQGVWSQFAWGHIEIIGGPWQIIVLAVTLCSLLGCARWLLRLRWTREASLNSAVLCLVVAGCGVWAMTLGWSLPYRWARPTLPSARYALPSVVPLMLLLLGGWQQVFPTQRKLLASQLFVAGVALLNLQAIWTIWHFYQGLPPTH
ncbi:MAG: hypothetical protein NVS2B7_17740 [Herpetosiphon sp.]